MNDTEFQAQPTEFSQENNLNGDTNISGANKSTIIAIALLILFFPVGYLYMLIATKWPIWVKLVITLLLAIPIVAFVIAPALVLTATVNPVKQMDRAQEAKLASEANKRCLVFYGCISKQGSINGCNSVEKIFAGNTNVLEDPEVDVRVETKGTVVIVTTSLKSKKESECSFRCGYDFSNQTDIEFVTVDPDKCLFSK